MSDLPYRTETPAAVALNLLGRASAYFGDAETAPDENWFRQYFLLTRTPMVLTEEGWEDPSCIAEYRKEDPDWQPLEVLEGEASSLYFILNRWNQATLFKCEADNASEALAKAVSENVDLTGADLTKADLAGANLAGVRLYGADLNGASLSNADLYNADLCEANLYHANLAGANLYGAHLHGADLAGANLTPIRDDLWAVLSAAPREVEGLRAAIAEGRVDGSTYEGKCSCLVGTLANVAGIGYDSLPLVKPNSFRPAERFFLGIRHGDTPDNNQFSRLALEWVDTWLAGMRDAFGPGNSVAPILPE